MDTYAGSVPVAERVYPPLKSSYRSRTKRTAEMPSFLLTNFIRRDIVYSERRDFMNMGDIVSLISTVGFPIVSCIAMGWYVKYTTDKNREQINEMNTQHKAEMDVLTAAINNNTLALQKLSDKLEKE